MSLNVGDGVGTNAVFGNISSMFPDHAGNIYFVCGTNIRKMDAKTNVVTLAGTFNQNNVTFADGPGNIALFNNASGGCFSQGAIFIADTGNNRIRKLSFNAQPQIVPPANLQLNTYPGVQITGTVGRTYQIQTSTDSKTWTPAATVLLNASPYVWIDQNPIAGIKLYRALMLP